MKDQKMKHSTKLIHLLAHSCILLYKTTLDESTNVYYYWQSHNYDFPRSKAVIMLKMLRFIVNHVLKQS